jgi:SAM-dependent methyltransferase
MKFFGSWFLFFQVKWFLWREKKEVRRRFPGFYVYERAFDRAYRFVNPFQICKQHLKQRGERDVDAYGESTLPALATITQECSLKAEDIVYEMGCGRGRGAFFLSYLVGCRVVGIDWVLFFINTAKAIAASTTPVLPVHFRCEEMQHVDFKEATVIYLYGTCLTEESIEKLVSAFEKLSPKVKFITVSYSLEEYSSNFCTLKQFTVTFPWGEADVFLSRLKCSVSKASPSFQPEARHK